MSSSSREGRSVAASVVSEQVYMVFPDDLSANDTVFGGLILAQMDRYCTVAAERHAGGTCVVVGLDAVHFRAPARRGEVLVFNASVNCAWHTSMEVGCRVETEAVGSGARRHVLSAYFTFVRTDEHGKPRPVPRLAPETVLEQARFEEAAVRRTMRLARREELGRVRSSLLPPAVFTPAFPAS